MGPLAVFNFRSSIVDGGLIPPASPDSNLYTETAIFGAPTERNGGKNWSLAQAKRVARLVEKGEKNKYSRKGRKRWVGAHRYPFVRIPFRVGTPPSLNLYQLALFSITPSTVISGFRSAFIQQRPS